MKLKHLARLQYGDALAVDARKGGGVSVYGSNGQIGVHSKSNFNAPGIVVGRKGSYGKVTWAPDGGFCIDTAYFIDRSSTQADLRYAFYLLLSLRLDEGSRDSAVPGLDRQIAHDSIIPTVDPAAQKDIACFLDQQTARVDKLVDKLMGGASLSAKANNLNGRTGKSLCGLLMEYRAALITAAVTGQIDAATRRKRGNTDRRLERIDAEARA